jgi:hypothetical protein
MFIDFVHRPVFLEKHWTMEKVHKRDSFKSSYFVSDRTQLARHEETNETHSYVSVWSQR